MPTSAQCKGQGQSTFLTMCYTSSCILPLLMLPGEPQIPRFSLDAGIPQAPQAADPPPWQGLWHLRANKSGIFQPSIFFVACGQSHKWVSEESLGSQLLPGHQQERQLTVSRMLDLCLLCVRKPGSKCQYNCSDLPADRRKSSPLHQPFCKGFAILLWVRINIIHSLTSHQVYKFDLD